MSKPTKDLIFKKYQIKKLIASTHFGFLYEGINIKNKEPVAMKFERKISKHKLLESEAYMLFLLKGYGIPKIITYGVSGLFNVLIEELLGLSIQAIWNEKKYNKKLILKDICMIALQCIDRLEYIHSKDIIHRDIKPLNCTIGKEDPNLIYLIDFGFAHKFRSSRTGKHIRFKNLRKILGSMRYLSINANKGYEQSRRDDLESLGYMLAYLCKKDLPWIVLEKQKVNKIKKYKIVCASKIKNTPEILFKGMPVEFVKYLKYVKNLEFEQDPDYNYMRQLFLDVMNRNNFINDCIFSWVLNKKIKIGKDMRSLDNRSFDKKSDKYNLLNKNNRKHSQKRLYNKIKQSLQETKRARSLDDDAHKTLSLDTFENNKNIQIINNKNPLVKNIEKKYETKFISPIKGINNLKISNYIYQKKKIKNLKIIRKENKNNLDSLHLNRYNYEKNPIDNKTFNNDYYSLNTDKDILYKNNLNDSQRLMKNIKNNNKNIINITHLLNTKGLALRSNSNNSIFNDVKKSINRVKKEKNEIDICSYNFKLNNTYRTLRERENSVNKSCNDYEKYKIKRTNRYQNYINKIPINIKINNSINYLNKNGNKITKKRSRNKVITPNEKKTKIINFNLNPNTVFFQKNLRESLSFNNLRHHQNFDKINNFNRFHLNNFTNNNIDENTFKSNEILNFNLSLDKLKYRPDIKINKNYNINIINHKRINSSTSLFNSDNKLYMQNNSNNRFIKSFNYIPLSIKKLKGKFC